LKPLNPQPRTLAGPTLAALLALLALSPWASALAAGNRGLHATALGEGEIITADGILDEPAWQRAEVITGFRGLYPTEGFDPAGTTEVRILVDERTIHLGFLCRFDDEVRVRAYLSEREDINDDDQVGIYLDPFGDGRRAYIFYINALGVQQDMLMGQGDLWNPDWNAIYSSGAKIVDGGFDVEVSIPFRSLRFAENSDLPWRIMLTRKFAQRDEKASYPRIRADRGPWLQQFLPLHGIEAQRSGVGLEFLPTVVGRTGMQREDSESALAWRKPSFPETVDPGLGVKIRITPSITLDATVNPDFSQVEADPDRIDNNLRFALFLPERRPFFLEGKELYNRHLLYTRSVVDPIYGIKVSGKQGRLSLALLHALDEAPSPSFVAEAATPGFSSEDVADSLAFVTYLGVAWDIGKRSKISFSYNDKEIVKTQEKRLHSNYHSFDLTTEIALGPSSMARIWLNGSDTGLTDGSERLRGLRIGTFVDRGSRYWGGGFGGDLTTPDFRMENALLNRTDVADLWLYGWRRLEPPRGPLRTIDLSITAKQGFESLSDDPVASYSEISYGADFRLPAATRIEVDAVLRDSLYLGKNFQGGKLEFELSNRALEIVQGELGGSIGEGVRYSDATLTLQREVAGELRLRAFRRLSVDLATRINVLGRAGEALERLWIYRLKATLGFTRALSLRLIAQGREDALFSAEREVTGRASRLDLSALLTLLPRPGTAIYLGYGHRLTWGDEYGTRTDAIDIFLKGSLLIRL
jgi:hypothetical protein